MDVFTTADGPQAAVDVVRARRGTWFDPRLADAFLATSPDDVLWLRLASDNANEVLRELEPEATVAMADHSSTLLRWLG